MKTNEITFTPEENAIFEAAWDYDELPGIETPYLYHYRSGSSLNDIFAQDSIRLRFTRGDCFTDKMEGNAVEVYYDLAIEELLSKGLITEKQSNRISDVRPPNVMLAMEKRNGIDWFTEKEYDPYILCFSTEKDDPFMFENSIKNKASGRYYFSMDSTIVEQMKQLGRRNGVHIEPGKILYGRSVIEHIKRKILFVFEKPFLNDVADVFLQDYLHKLQFLAKLSKFKKENEVRVIAKVPKELSMDHRDLFFAEDKKHITLKIPKSYVWGITPKEDNDKAFDKELLSMLFQRGYPYALSNLKEVTP